MLDGDSVHGEKFLAVHACIVGAVQEDGDEPVGAVEGDDVAWRRSAAVGRDSNWGRELRVPSLKLDAVEGARGLASISREMKGVLWGSFDRKGSDREEIEAERGRKSELTGKPRP